MIGVKIIVDGIVQGVGFRWFTSRQARQLGVTGWARNRLRGDVEIYAEGDRTTLETFILEVKAGPRFGRVDAIDVEWKEYTGQFSDFNIRG